MSMVHLLNVTLTAIETIGTIWYLVMLSMLKQFAASKAMYSGCMSGVSAGFDAMLMQPNLSFLSYLSCNMENNKITTLPLFSSPNSVLCFFVHAFHIVSPHLVTVPARHG